MHLILWLLHQMSGVESRDLVSRAPISAASRSLLAPSEGMTITMPPTLRFAMLTLDLDFNLFLSPLPSVACFMTSIFHMCRGVSSFNSPRFFKSPFFTFSLSILPPPRRPC